MRIAIERRLLQGTTAVLCLVPISMGIASVARSAAVLRGVPAPLPVDLDSHYRYLSGLLLGIGLAFLVSIPKIESHAVTFRVLGGVIVIGGLSRLLALIQTGVPSAGHCLGLGLELIAVPLVVIWQGRVARRYSS